MFDPLVFFGGAIFGAIVVFAVLSAKEREWKQFGIFSVLAIFSFAEFYLVDFFLFFLVESFL